jgi:hypothetical protein
MIAQKFLLAMLPDFAMSGEHEVCSIVHSRLRCICITNIRRFTPSLSGKTGAAI